MIGNWLLQAFLDMAGTGDVGPTLRVASDSPSDPDQNLPRLEQPHGRPYLSIFGEVTIERTCYGQDRVEAAPLDAQLHLPQRQYSYLLQQWLGSFVVDDAHAEAIRKLETILGLEITVRASEDLNREQASDVEVFQDRLPVPNAAEEGPLLVVTADCKGVPLVPSRRAAGRGDRHPPANPGEPAPWQGREGEQEEDGGGGGGVYDRAVCANGRRCDRGSDAEEGPRAPPSPQNKRVCAELLVGKVALFLWLADEVIRRNPRGEQARDLPLGWGTGVHDRQSEYLPENTVCILDLFHVMERLWKVAWCFFDERTQKHKRISGWKSVSGGCWRRKVDAVIRGMRYQATERGLKGQERKTVRGAAEYFERNRDRMKYDEYLAAGYPIGSGVVEGACRHLVKDRMERTDALAAVRSTSDVGPTSHLPQWRVECLLELPRDAGRPTALRQNTESWVTPTQ